MRKRLKGSFKYRNIDLNIKTLFDLKEVLHLYNRKSVKLKIRQQIHNAPTPVDIPLLIYKV